MKAKPERMAPRARGSADQTNPIAETPRVLRAPLPFVQDVSAPLPPPFAPAGRRGEPPARIDDGEQEAEEWTFHVSEGRMCQALSDTGLRFL